MKIETTADMRKFLVDQMMATALGKVETGQAKSVCNFAQQVYNTVKLEMQFAQLKSKGTLTGIEPVSWKSQETTKRLR